eukprot:7378400-Prymnesium_polylepis.1
MWVAENARLCGTLSCAKQRFCTQPTQFTNGERARPPHVKHVARAHLLHALDDAPRGVDILPLHDVVRRRVARRP